MTRLRVLAAIGLVAFAAACGPGGKAADKEAEAASDGNVESSAPPEEDTPMETIEQQAKDKEG